MAAPSNPNDPPLDAARRIALRLLAPAPLTCEQLRRKLRSRGVLPDTVSAVVDELIDRRLLDDAERWSYRPGEVIDAHRYFDIAHYLSIAANYLCDQPNLGRGDQKRDRQAQRNCLWILDAALLHEPI